MYFYALQKLDLFYFIFLKIETNGSWSFFWRLCQFFLVFSYLFWDLSLVNTNVNLDIFKDLFAITVVLLICRAKWHSFVKYDVKFVNLGHFNLNFSKIYNLACKSTVLQLSEKDLFDRDVIIFSVGLWSGEMSGTPRLCAV